MAKVPEPLEFGIQKVLGRDHLTRCYRLGPATRKCQETKDGGSFPFPRWAAVIAFSATIGSVQRVFQWLFPFIASWCLRCYGWRLKFKGCPLSTNPRETYQNSKQPFAELRFFFGACMRVIEVLDLKQTETSGVQTCSATAKTSSGNRKSEKGGMVLSFDCGSNGFSETTPLLRNETHHPQQSQHDDFLFMFLIHQGSSQSLKMWPANHRTVGDFFFYACLVNCWNDTMSTTTLWEYPRTGYLDCWCTVCRKGRLKTATCIYH